MKRWEYKMVRQAQLDAHDLEYELNILGRDGWELCSIDWGCCIFKREIIADDRY